MVPSQRVHGLLFSILFAFILQIGLVAYFALERNREVRENTRTLEADDLINLVGLLSRMDQAETRTLAELVNYPAAQIEFVNEIPAPDGISWLDEWLGLNTQRSVIVMNEGPYVVISHRQALDDSYAFFGQLGLITAIFFIVLVAVLLRARAALHPVQQFALAAERLSKDLHAPPMKPQSSPDLQQAVDAVNRMQVALQEQLADRTQMIAGIGHDLRTYITRLSLRAELWTNEDLKARTLQDLKEMTAVVNQSLELGAADQRQDLLEEVAMQPFLTQLIQGFFEAHQPVEVRSIKDAQVRIGKTSLSRALQNLIENAVRYGGRAYISAARQGDSYVILVEDEGPGIPKDKRQEVLKPFVRLETSRNRTTGGTGLGLALAKTLIGQHKGVLRLDAAPSGGLRAVVSLPLSK